jgi:hypothetical protein
MKNLKTTLGILKNITEIAIVVAVSVILAISLWTKTPVLELTGLDSQWWILLLCLLTFLKVGGTDDVQ